MSEAVQEAPVRLPTVGQVDPQVLAEEKAFLAEAEAQGLGSRIRAYSKLSGPGWLQGAMTLGGGSAASSLLAGTVAGYEFLWVQPLALVTGIIMLMAISHLTLTTGQRPFEFMSRYAHPALAWGWALASLLASIVWSFPQYSLAESVFRDIATQFGVAANNNPAFTWVVSLGIFAFATFITLNYGKTGGWIKRYELILKLMVGMIIVSFLGVVIAVDVDWAAVWKGFTAFRMPNTPQETGIVISAFATAVGINMTFLFPYSQISKGWGREHRGLAKFDLWTGLLVPFVFATSLIIIASAVTLHGTFDMSGAAKPGAVDLAKALEPAVGQKASHFIFGLGILGMTISTIPLLMLVSGFIMGELTGTHSRRAFVVGALMPGLGVLAPIYWSKLQFYMAIPTSTLCFFLMPIAYLGFLILMNRRALLGDETPTGLRRLIWNVPMSLVLAIVTYGGFYLIRSRAQDPADSLQGVFGVLQYVYVALMAGVFLWGFTTIVRHGGEDKVSAS